ncbi:MAG: type IV pilus modification protein PilV [Lautropia sp.]|nr:type IV pilus modification protein PilV [Lautropia sp.]
MQKPHRPTGKTCCCARANDVSGRQRGSSMIEVLVAVVLLSVGMLSMLWAQSKSMQYERSAELRGIALQLSAALSDRIRANSGAAASYAFTVAYDANRNIPAAGTNCNTTVCTPEQMAAFDLSELRRSIRNSLPGGDFYVENLGQGRMNIWALWLQPVSSAGSEDDEDPNISFSSMCPQGIGRPTIVPQCMPLGVML